MAKGKKVILFIVEGISDKVSLESIFEQYFEDYKTKIAVMHGDITSQSSSSDIKANLSDKIDYFCQIEGIQFKYDIIRIVHLVDTDGAFVPPSCVVSGEKDIEYTLTQIITNNVEGIKYRNASKATVLKVLSKMRKLNNIPYSIYYFSRNLEHVLHNESGDLTDEQKKNLSESFDLKYEDKLDEFLGFITDSNFAVPGDYKQTWDFIMQGTNSLNRFSNVPLLFPRNTRSARSDLIEDKAD